jgi:hypothetical protein
MPCNAMHKVAWKKERERSERSGGCECLRGSLVTPCHVVAFPSIQTINSYPQKNAIELTNHVKGGNLSTTKIMTAYNHPYHLVLKQCTLNADHFVPSTYNVRTYCSLVGYIRSPGSRLGKNVTSFLDMLKDKLS